MKSSITDISRKFSYWDFIINDYLSQQDLGYEQNNQIHNLHDVFAEILIYFISSSTLKNDWKCTNSPTSSLAGQFASVMSKKFITEIDFGLYSGELYMHSYLSGAICLRNMDDEFWRSILDLSMLGTFEFCENVIPQVQKGSEAEKLMRHNKSQIFRIIRNYLFLETTGGGTLDLGALEVRWPLGTPWEQILEQGRKAFCKIYHINYLLYRAGYLARRVRMRT